MKEKVITKIVKKEIPVIQEVQVVKKVPVYVDKVELNPVYVDRKIPVQATATKMPDVVTENAGETVDVGQKVVNSKMIYNSQEPVHVDSVFVGERDTRKAGSYAPQQAATFINSSSPGRYVTTYNPGSTTNISKPNFVAKSLDIGTPPN